MNSLNIKMTKPGSDSAGGKGTWSIQVMARCGILTSLLYIVMNVVIPMFYEGYDSASQTVSELSAVGAPTRLVWVLLGFVYILLMIAFAWGIIMTAESNRFLRKTGILMLIYGVVSLAWPFAPMHLREVLAAGGATVSDTLHLSLAGVTVLLMLLAMGFGAAAFGKPFRIYSITSMFILLVFGILTSMDAPKIDANLPTPMIGVWERINIGVYLFWVIVLALVLIKKETPTSNL